MNATCVGVVNDDLYISGLVIFGVCWCLAIAMLFYTFCAVNLDVKRKVLVLLIVLECCTNIIWFALADCRKYVAGSPENKVSFIFQRISFLLIFLALLTLLYFWMTSVHSHYTSSRGSYIILQKVYVNHCFFVRVRNGLQSLSCFIKVL